MQGSSAGGEYKQGFEDGTASHTLIFFGVLFAVHFFFSFFSLRTYPPPTQSGLATMEDSKLQRLHDTLKKLAPKGNHVSVVCLGSSRDVLVEGFKDISVKCGANSSPLDHVQYALSAEICT